MNIRQPIPSRLHKTKPRPTTPPTRARAKEVVGGTWIFLEAYGEGRSATGYDLGSAATVAQRPRWSSRERCRSWSGGANPVRATFASNYEHFCIQFMNETVLYRHNSCPNPEMVVRSFLIEWMPPLSGLSPSSGASLTIATSTSTYWVAIFVGRSRGRRRTPY